MLEKRKKSVTGRVALMGGFQLYASRLKYRWTSPAATKTLYQGNQESVLCLNKNKKVLTLQWPMGKRQR